MNDTTIRLTFNEGVDSVSALNANYNFNAFTSVKTVTPIGPDFTQVLVSLVTRLPDGSDNVLNVNGISDCRGNIRSFTNIKYRFTKPLPANRYDVVISEIMAYPQFGGLLPSVEYLELHNVSNKVIDLHNWRISDATSSSKLPRYIMFPGEYVILCSKTNEASFQAFGTVVALSLLPSLNNAGDTLTLRDSLFKYIHGVNYDDDWHATAQKKSGGWSLEMIDSSNPCAGASNWTSSLDPKGGTPGARNSVARSNPDIVAPQVLKVFPNATNTIEVTFNEAVDSTSLTSTSGYSILPGNIRVAQARPNANPATKVTLTLNGNLRTRVRYALVTPGMMDCNGNLSMADTFYFSLATRPRAGEVVINEILFNPRTGGVDFIELYNNSDSSTVDLRALQLTNRDAQGNVNTLDGVSLSPDGGSLGPREYLVFTESLSLLDRDYNIPFPEKVVELAELPSYNDDEGSVVLYRPDSSLVLDQVDYRDDWQSKLLGDKEGVSLEKISPSLPSNSQSSWQSASGDVGFATLTYQNSQFTGVTLGELDDAFSLEDEVLSPDGDGYQDVLQIKYNLPGPGYIANAWIYDILGRQVRRLIISESLSLQGLSTWDGVTDTGERAKVGAYLLLVEYFEASGKVGSQKLPFSVAGKL